MLAVKIYSFHHKKRRRCTGAFFNNYITEEQPLVAPRHEQPFEQSESDLQSPPHFGSVPPKTFFISSLVSFFSFFNMFKKLIG